MAFFNKPTNKRPMTRPSSAPASKRSAKKMPLKIVMPHKGSKRGRSPSMGQQYPQQ